MSEPSSTLFCRFECGCMGLAQPLVSGLYVVVMACEEHRDQPEPGPYFTTQNMEKMACQPVSPEREAELRRSLSDACMQSRWYSRLRSGRDDG